MEKLQFITGYKEPLNKVVNGFGFYGAIMGTEDGEKIQCHTCGKLFARIAPHARQKHGLKVREYREMYGIAYSTSLCSENESNRLAEKMHETGLANKGIRYYRKMGKLGNEKRHHELMPKITLETLNKRGICPDQILDKIKQCKEKVGHIPTLEEFREFTGGEKGQKYKRAVFRIFGSWNKALEMLRYTTISARKEYTDAELLEYINNFYNLNKRFPYRSDFNKHLIPSVNVYRYHFGSWEKVKKIIELEYL